MAETIDPIKRDLVEIVFEKLLADNFGKSASLSEAEVIAKALIDRISAALYPIHRERALKEENPTVELYCEFCGDDRVMEINSEGFVKCQDCGTRFEPLWHKCDDQETSEDEE